MEALKTSSDTLFILLGAIMVLAMHAGFAFLELGTVRRKNQVNALMKILCDFAISTVAYFFIGYAVAYGVGFLAGAEQARGEERLRPRQVLLPAHLRGRGAGDRLGRHRRARAVQSAARRDRGHRRLRLSVLRRHRVERGLRRPGVARSERGRQVPRFRRLGRRARGRRLDRARGGDPARAAHRPLSEGRRRDRAAAVEHSVPRARRVGAERRLVRVQRDVGADDRQDLRARRGEFADGDGGRHARGAHLRPQRSGLRAQRAARGAGRDLRGLGRDASDRRARRRASSRARSSSSCSRSRRTG